MNFGTPIVSIVDYVLDTEQSNPDLLNANAYIQNNSSSPVFVSVVNLSSLSVINTVVNVGYISNMPVVNVIAQGGQLQVNGGYLANISAIPPVAVTAISAPVAVSISSKLNNVPNPVYDGLIALGTILNTGSTSPFALLGAKQIDMAVVISSVTGTSVNFQFSLITVDGTLGVPYATYNMTTRTTAGAYWMTVPSGNFLGDYAFVGYSVSGTSTALTGVWVRVVAK